MPDENFIEKIEDLAGRAFGDLECLVRHPLYFITAYQARVDEKLIRGSWPNQSELGGLLAQGVQSIVNLCAEREDKRDYRMFNIAVVDNTPPAADQVERFLEIVRDSHLTYVHCEQGKGRTGCMVAAYRVTVNGWTPAAALKEAEGFGLSFPAQKDWILAL